MLTATRQSGTGYWIESIKQNIYSIEEINYFLYHHIDQVYRDFFSEELFDYIEVELQQPLMARDLRDLADQDARTSDFVRYVLNESFYYNSRELAEISSLVAGIDNMGKAERIKIQADAFYRAGNFNSALQCYFQILKGIGTEEVSNAFYGRVAYAVGIIYARMFMSKSANTYFSYAYSLSPDPAYAKACVYMSIIFGDDEDLLASIVRYKINDDSLDSIRSRVKATRHELGMQEATQQFIASLEDDGAAASLVEELKAEYYNMLK